MDSCSQGIIEVAGLFANPGVCEEIKKYLKMLICWIDDDLGSKAL